MDFVMLFALNKGSLIAKMKPIGLISVNYQLHIYKMYACVLFAYCKITAKIANFCQ